MKIIVTDSWGIWNHENPCLKQFRDDVLVVCLHGKKVTDEYECFVYPYTPFAGLGEDNSGIGSMVYKSLEAAADSLMQQLQYEDDVLFLTDYAVESLYPFYLLKRRNENVRFHLFAMTPLRFMEMQDRKAYAEMTSDLSCIMSVCCLDSELLYSEKDGEYSYEKMKTALSESCAKLLPEIVAGMDDIENASFFDIGSMSFVPVNDGFDSIIQLNDHDEEADETVEVVKGMLGVREVFPWNDENVRETIEKPAARLAGKKICSLLREYRLQLAAKNGIEFTSEECPSTGPCAGTCTKCDREAAYLRDRLAEIPEAGQKIPFFSIPEEVTRWYEK